MPDNMMDTYHACVLMTLTYKHKKTMLLKLNNCNKCVNCLDKPINGGVGKRKQLCLIKKYINNLIT
jgi:hypothetical protein